MERSGFIAGGDSPVVPKSKKSFKKLRGFFVLGECKLKNSEYNPSIEIRFAFFVKQKNKILSRFFYSVFINY